MFGVNSIAAASSSCAFTNASFGCRTLIDEEPSSPTQLRNSLLLPTDLRSTLYTISVCSSRFHCSLRHRQNDFVRPTTQTGNRHVPCMVAGMLNPNPASTRTAAIFQILPYVLQDGQGFKNAVPRYATCIFKYAAYMYTVYMSNALRYSPRPSLVLFPL